MANQEYGLFNPQDLDPYNYARQQDAIFKANALAEAQLNPEEGMIYDAKVRGRNIAQGFADIFGAKSKDPGLKRASDMDAIFKSLSEEDLKDTPGALNKIADRAAALGHTQDAINYRMKASSIAQEQIDRDTTNALNKSKLNTDKVTRIGKMANGTLSSFATLASNQELLEGVWSDYVNEIEENFGKAEADKRRKITSLEGRKAQLTKDFESAETNAVTNQGLRAEAKQASDNARKTLEIDAKMASEAIKADALLKHQNKMFDVQYARLALAGDKVALDAQANLIQSSFDAMSQFNTQIDDKQHEIDKYNDPASTPLIEPATREKLLNQLKATKKSLEKQRDAVKGDLEVLQQSYTKGLSSIGVTRPSEGSSPVPPSEDSGGSKPPKTKEEIDTAWVAVQKYKGQPGYATALAAFDEYFPGERASRVEASVPQKAVPAKAVTVKEAIKANLSKDDRVVDSWLGSQGRAFKARATAFNQRRAEAKKLLKDSAYLKTLNSTQKQQLLRIASGI